MIRQTVVLVSLLLLPCLCMGAIIHVPGDSVTIQAGIDGAAEGDTVLVADGIYGGSGNVAINFGGKNLVLTSINGAEYTLLQSGLWEQSFRFISGEDTSSVVDGFTIRRAQWEDFAGRLLIDGASPTIRNCVFDSCGIRGIGSAIYCVRCTTTISGCTFVGCGSEGNGGAVRVDTSDVILRDCVFENNRAGNLYYATGGSGGAIYSTHSHLELLNCLFVNNRAYGTGGHGGGAVCVNSTFLEATQCRFTDNECVNSIFTHGGAVKAGGLGCFCYISECVFDGNSSDGMAGVISSDTDSTSMVSCTFVGNASGEGFAGSVFVSASPMTIYNSILAFNTGYGLAYASNDLYVECTDAYGNSGGDWTEFMAPFADINGNFSLNPLFCDTANGDYYLAENSICIPEKSPCASLIGALEVGCDALCGDVNADGAVDIDDPVFLVSYVFSFGPAPIPLSVGDCDCSDGGTPIDIDDIVHLMDYILRGGPEPCDADGDGVPDC